MPMYDLAEVGGNTEQSRKSGAVTWKGMSRKREGGKGMNVLHDMRDVAGNARGGQVEVSTLYHSLNNTHPFFLTVVHGSSSR